MKIKIQQLLFVFFLIITFVPLSDAVVWENIPAFPQARRERQEEMLINNKPVHNVIYSTDSPKEEILEFYKTKMMNFGWSLQTESVQEGMGMLVFAKKETSASIVVQNIMGRNFITVVESQIPETPDTQADCPECEQKKLDELMKKLESLPQDAEGIVELPVEAAPDAAGIPKQDSPGKDLQLVPRYPSATRMNSVERYNGKRVDLTYFSADSVEKIESFYRQNMGVNNWTLDKEADFKDAPPPPPEMMSINLKGKSLLFKSSYASCIINIFQEPQGKGTIIGINYNEK